MTIRDDERASPGGDACLVLFTKPAVAGRVKTRLVGRLTAEQAAELHAAFLGDLSARLGESRWTLWTAWDLADGESPALELLDLRERGAPAGRALRQEGSDLGARLYRALREAADAGFDRVAAVGSDHPTMPVSRLEECDRAFDRGAEVVIGPAADGGYYLIALRSSSLQRSLFDRIDWSTERVLEQTLQRCAEAGTRVELLEVGHDVDRPADLERLARELAAAPGLCPRTLELLEGWSST